MPWAVCCHFSLENCVGSFVKPLCQALMRNLQDINLSPWSTASNLKPSGSSRASEDDGHSLQEPPVIQADNDWEPRENPASRALLSREDLDRHFGYGLKEAARRLGVCKTTLKRACRHATSYHNP